jgi:hypothetical protein
VWKEKSVEFELGFVVQASQAAEKVAYFGILSEARNLSLI